MKYILKNENTKEIVALSLDEILKEINRDRSDDFIPYSKNDWVDGLENCTEYSRVSDHQKTAALIAAAPEMLDLIEVFTAEDLEWNADVISNFYRAAEIVKANAKGGTE